MVCDSEGSAAHLHAIVDLLPMDQVHAIFKELSNICTSPAGVDESAQVASATTTAKATGAPQFRNWQAKEGALHGVTAIIKKFRRMQHGGAASSSFSSAAAAKRGSSSPSPKSKEANLGKNDGEDSEKVTEAAAATASPTASVTPKGGLATSPTTPKAAVARQKRRPTIPEKDLEVSENGLRTTPVHVMTALGNDLSQMPPSPAGRSQSFDWQDTSSVLSSSSEKSPSTTSSPLRTSSTGTDDERQMQKSPASGGYLTFGKSYTCNGGLPSFINSAMKAVTFTLIGHPQLSVRENATKAFAAFLSRSPPDLTLGAFGDVIGRLKESTISIANAYLAEGLLSLLVILARLKILTHVHLHAHWDTVIATLKCIFAIQHQQCGKLRALSSSISSSSRIWESSPVQIWSNLHHPWLYQ